MLVAFASSDGISIDSHFASAPAFELYQFTRKTQGSIHSSLIMKNTTESDDKVDDRINVLKECAIIYSTQIGGPAAARLVQSGIYPMKAKDGTLIVDEINRLGKLITSQNLPPWMRKKLDKEEVETVE